MRSIKLFLSLVITLGIVVIALILIQKKDAGNPPRVVFSTEEGMIEIEVFSDKAPVTSTNFLRYVDENRFSGASFYRVVTPDNQSNDSIRIQVIQGGLGFGESSLRLPPIQHETTEETGILHKHGTISMARLHPGSADSEFFICIGEQPELDYEGRRNPDRQGFAAFGQVVRGMDVVLKIQELPAEEQMLKEPVKILEVWREE